MPDSTTASTAFLSVTRDPRGAEALYRLASSIRGEHDHVELDPIHFIAAAVATPSPAPRVRNLFDHYGIPVDIAFVEQAMAHTPPEHWKVKPGHNGDTIEPVNQDTRELFKRLAGRYDQYLNGRVQEMGDSLSTSTWEWSIALIQVALELESPSIAALHAAAFRLRH